MTSAVAVAPAACVSPVSSLAHFGFLTLPNFSMIAFSSAVEVLRMANYVGRADHYQWSIYSLDGSPVHASNGIAVRPTQALDYTNLPDVMIVCGGIRIRDVVDEGARDTLAALAERGLPLGGICTGAYALMSSGLLDGYRCTVHWENLSALHSEFPQVGFADELFVVDRDRLTCTGGTAPLDLMLNLVGMRFGQQLAAQVSEQFILERIRSSTDTQPIPVDARVGFSRAELIEVVRLMEANIEEPLSLEARAARAAVAAAPAAHVQGVPERVADPLLPDAAPEARARSAAHDRRVDRTRDDGLRLSFALPFQQGLPCAVRPRAELRAPVAGALTDPRSATPPGSRRAASINDPAFKQTTSL